MTHETPARLADDHLTMVVDLDERGCFRAHVENANGKTLFEFSNEDDDEECEGGLWLVDMGYMRHARDEAGLLDYMRAMGMVGANSSMTVQG